MYNIESLEQILNIPLQITKNEQIIYQSKKNTNGYTFTLEQYTISSSCMINDSALNLIQIVLKYNDNIKPFWHRVLLNQSFQTTEIPELYGSNELKTVWLIKGKRIIYDLPIVKEMFESSEVIVVHKNLLVAIVIETEELTPYQLLDQLEMETMKNIIIIEGPHVVSIDEIHQSYEHALELDKMNITNNRVVQFKHALIEQLIALSQHDKLNAFYERYHEIYPMTNMNQELVETTHSFFKNNLNITDTANELFLHRNTLIYRLNKIQQLTQLDIRNFEDANKMKVLLIIKSNQID
ncbi:MAG: helix-turn-helix domain-containing protein [Clostridia bacterium]|nr:helix-turn-helix domain-containing protein [Clostridia bacterium]